MIKKVAVLGAGNAGCTFSGHLGMKGFKVRLFEYPRYKANIEGIIEKGGVEVTGAVQGFGKMELASTSMDEVVSEADLILVPVPAFAHEVIMSDLSQYLEDGQIIVFLPGNYCSIRFHNLLRERGIKKNILIAETNSMLYACRSIGPAKVHIRSIKNQLPLAALPAIHTGQVVNALNQCINNFVPGSNVLEISLGNLNCVVHSPTAILNAGRIENVKEGFDFYCEGMTESVTRVIEAVDHERLLVGSKLSLKLSSLKKTFIEYYNLRGKDLHELLTTSPIHANAGSPESLKDRYLSEDVPFGLVPISSLGKYLGCPTPNTDALIQLASTLNQTDYLAEGITMEKLQLTDLSLAEMKGFIEQGLDQKTAASDLKHNSGVDRMTGGDNIVSIS